VKIAVTGAAGFAGGNLCKALCAAGHEVLALVYHDQRALHGLPVTLVKGDVLDQAGLCRMFRSCQLVFHLAARISINGDPDGRVAQINVQGTRNALAAARDAAVSRFVHYSSIEALSQHPLQEPLDEQRPLVGADGFAYARSKAEADRAVLAACETGMDTVILNPSAMIGPLDAKPSLVGKMLLDLYRRRLPALVAGGFDIVDVRDVTHAALALLEPGAKQPRYVLGGGYISLRELASCFARLSGKPAPRLTTPLGLARAGLPIVRFASRLLGTTPLYTRESLSITANFNRAIDAGLASRKLGFKARPLEATLRDTLAWFKENDYL